jgi:hypothetical protein
MHTYPTSFATTLINLIRIALSLSLSLPPSLSHWMLNCYIANIGCVFLGNFETCTNASFTHSLSGFSICAHISQFHPLSLSHTNVSRYILYFQYYRLYGFWFMMVVSLSLSRSPWCEVNIHAKICNLTLLNFLKIM